LDPHADQRRRIPTRAYKGETLDCTAALRECVYLDELERQARIFTRSFSEAMTAALVADDAEECWRQIQSSMFAAIVVNRLVDATGAGRARRGVSKDQARGIAEDRAARLRELVSLPPPDEATSPIYAVRDIRDSMEHIDERLDRVTHGDDSRGGGSDWYLSDGHMAVTLSQDFPESTPLGLRSFIPTAGLLFFNDLHLNMFQLDLDMLALQHNINEAREGLAPRLTGRKTYGGSQVVEFSDAASRRSALDTWQAERVHRADSLHRTELAGVTIWLDSEDAQAGPDATLDE
jgi:hypothetical protein